MEHGEADTPIRLIVRENGQERTLELSTKVITIGRSKENQIEVEDISSSRRHCRLAQSNGCWAIEDLQSRNGTLVNGILVRKKELQPGDCIEIGKTRVYFERVPTESLLQSHPAGATMLLPTDYFMEPITEPLEKSQKMMKREREIFLRLQEVCKRLCDTVVLNQLLDIIIDTVLEITGAERGFIILQEGGELRIRASRNIDKEAVKKAEVKVSHSITSHVLRTGRPVLAGDARSDQQTREFNSVRDLRLESVLCVPLRYRGANIGVIYVDNRFERNAFHSNQLRFIEFLADQAAINIENARLFEENRRIQDEQRKAIEDRETIGRQLQEKLLASEATLDVVKEVLSRKSTHNFKYNYSSIITKSPKMYQLFEMIDKIIDTDVPVLIQGESGTGKELVAKAIHEQGKRAQGPFIPQNCAAIPPNLLESEFFGHVRGAFTGAVQNKKGLFQEADGGTLFLDEIGDMSLDLQTKLLRVIEDRRIRPVGGKDLVEVDVRIISATNRPLKEMMERKQFRDDLFYRLNVLNVVLPPLRDRRDDIPLLVDFFLTNISLRTGRPKPQVDGQTLYHLMQYHWPGNVRELENEIERMFALAGDVITTELLSAALLESGEPRRRSITTQGTLKEVLTSRKEELEREVIERSLEELDWNKSKTAKALGVSRPTLDQKIDKYKLKRPVKPPKGES
ncbi:MAG: sigma 54-interacting transcriptional regulator [Planctomycetes bacterium]|nr:sigma 54-interacting transcriptional regulator [Planctomycetota bacterium]